MNIFLWIVGIIGAYLTYAYFAGANIERAYRKIIADLMEQLTWDPIQFFRPDFNISSNNSISTFELTELILDKIIPLALQRKVRLPINANLIPTDIVNLPDVKRDFENLVMLAHSIANTKN